MEGHWKCQGGKGSLNSQTFRKKSINKLNWNFLVGEGVQDNKPSLGGVWIFSGTTQINPVCHEHINSRNWCVEGGGFDSRKTALSTISTGFKPCKNEFS